MEPRMTSAPAQHPLCGNVPQREHNCWSYGRDSEIWRYSADDELIPNEEDGQGEKILVVCDIQVLLQMIKLYLSC